MRAAIFVAFATTVLPAQQAPLSNEWNRYLPAWLQLSGEYRARLEGYAGGGFKNDNSDDYLLSRLRLNLNIQPEDWFQIRLQAQDARALWKTLPAPPYQDTLDLRMAYLELGNAEKKGIALRAGRQEINFGDQRLVGGSNYTNNARTFDAVRLTLRHGGYRLDTFASTVVQAVDGEFDRPFRTRADNLYGLYGGMERLVPKAVLEPYVFWRVTRNLKTEAGKPGNRDFKTYGLRWVGKLPLHFDYNTEMAAQAGSLGADRIRAWAGHWQFGYTPSAKWKPRLVAEYNFATGDKNPHDGTRGTFDQLYPTAHDKYGLADQVGWRNIHDIRTGVELHPRAKWVVAPFYHSYWLASATDALYAANSAVLAQKTDGSAGTRVGQEADLSAAYAWNKQMQIGAGIGHLFPGEFLKKTTQGHGYTYPYLMVGYIF